MPVRARPLGRVCVLAFLALAAASPAAAATAPGKATGRALALRVVLPDGKVEVVAEAKAPPGSVATSGGLQYGDGIVSTGAVWARARATRGTKASGWAASTLRTVSLFGGEITIGAISTKATAEASARRARASLGGSWLAEVTILGQAVQAGPNVRVPLAEWGYAVLLEQAVVTESRRGVGKRTSVSGLHVTLTAEHGGLPAGTEIVVGYAEAAASVPRPAPPKATEEEAQPAAPVAPPKGPKRDPERQPPGSQPKPPPIVKSPPREVKPEITTDGYVFPVYGPASFTNDFEAPRAATGWHHGNDIFAPVGAPVLAVTDGTLFLVGWNDIGGNRLWLRDNQGNEFYFAHLSAFSPLAFEGSRVKAGDVIGFVGATGDAVGTPPHLHFEIHPAALLGLGYDGVVNPYPYLLAWRRVADATFDWGKPKPGQAPPPGLVILEAKDISSVSGLDAEALAETMEMPALFGKGLPAGEPSVAGSAGGL